MRKFAILSFLAATAALPAEGVTLYLQFSLGPLGSFTAESIPLTASAWHIGDATGPAPSDAQFASILSSLTDLEIGGHGTPAVVNNTTAAFEFNLSNPSLMGLVADTFPSGPAGWTGNGFTCCGWSFNGGTPGGQITGYSFAPGVGMFVAPSRYLGDQSAAVNGNLTFRLDPETNPGFNITYEYGLVTLSGTDSSTPEPSTYALVGGAILVLALKLSTRRS